MSFYGRVTNSSKTQFSFDKIYPSRHEMDFRLNQGNADGVFVGRYVLVEYGDSTKVETDLVTSDNYIHAFLRSLREDKFKNVIGTLYINNSLKPDAMLTGKEGQIAFVPIKDEGGMNHDLTGTYQENTYWVCKKIDEELCWVLIVASDSGYVANYQIDQEYYGAGRGYDSTVWTLSLVDGVYKFVMVAELNSVVPTFDIDADAPTDSPITPHWSGDSNNVYYKLHVQPNWGMRLKKATAPKLFKVDNDYGEVQDSEVSFIYDASTTKYNFNDGKHYVCKYTETDSGIVYTTTPELVPKGTPVEEFDKLNRYFVKPEKYSMPSDETVVWARTEYDKNTKKLRYYYYSTRDKWVEYDPAELDPNAQPDANLGAAIYYNKAGFDPEISHYSEDEKYQVQGDSIQFESSGHSGHDYGSHGLPNNYAADVKELSVMLPSLGDTMAKVWDTVYGDREMNNLKDGRYTENLKNKYVKLNLTASEFKDKVTELQNLDNSYSQEYRHLYYKKSLGDDSVFVSLGINHNFNSNLEYYQLVKGFGRNMDMSWQDGYTTAVLKEEPKGLRMIRKAEDGWTYDTKQVQTVAGAVNSVHDLMGMIISPLENSENIDKLSDDIIYHYEGETAEVDTGLDDILLVRNDNGEVVNDATVSAKNHKMNLEKGKYYLKRPLNQLQEVDTLNWKNKEDVTDLYKWVDLEDFNNKFFYKEKRIEDDKTYYNYYRNDDELTPSNRTYLKGNYDTLLTKHEVKIAPAYQPEEYYLYDPNSSTYTLDTSANGQLEREYFKLNDDWRAGDIYVPGCYYVKKGSIWETTFTPAFTSNGWTTLNKPHPYDKNNNYYGINYNNLEVNYVQVVGSDGTIRLEQQKTYQIDKAQKANLIDYKKLYEVNLTPIAYVSITVNNEDDYNELASTKLAEGGTLTLYKEEDHSGILRIVETTQYDPEVKQYFIRHWGPDGTIASDTTVAVPSVTVGTEIYQSGNFFTYRYKPITIAGREWIAYTPSEYESIQKLPDFKESDYQEVVVANGTTYHLKAVDSSFDKLKAGQVLYKASTNEKDYIPVKALTAADYIPNTVFYKYSENNNNSFILAVDAKFDEKKTYYTTKLTKVETNEAFDSSASYFVLAPVVALEDNFINGVQYYTFNSAKALDVKNVLDFDDITNTSMVLCRWDKTYKEANVNKDNFNNLKTNLFVETSDGFAAVNTETAVFDANVTYYTCTNSIEDRHYRLNADLYSLPCITGDFASYRLYQPGKYYHKTAPTSKKYGYEIDLSTNGTYTIEYKLDESNKFDINKRYFELNQNTQKYQEVEPKVNKDTYIANKFFIQYNKYDIYYEWDNKQDELVEHAFYVPGKYYYKLDDAFFLDTSSKFNPDHRPYYEATALYVMSDDLNAYSRGAVWNINILPVPQTVHLGKISKRGSQLVELKDFGRTYNTINGLIAEINKCLGLMDEDTRDTATVQGAVAKIQDIVAQFGAMSPSQLMVVDSYGRVRSAEDNCAQSDAITNFGGQTPVTKNLNKEGTILTEEVAEKDRRIKDRWISIELPIYSYKGEKYTDYEKVNAAVKADNPTFAIYKNEQNTKYFYQWTPETNADFEKNKNALYTAVESAEIANNVYKVLTSVELVQGPKVEGTEYWFNIGDSFGGNMWSRGEAIHHLIGNEAEVQVKHTFIAQKDTTTESNKNTAEGTGLNVGDGDDLKLYTPIIDSTGHVVAHNEETVKLPFGFKYLKTNGASETSDADLFTSNASNKDNTTTEETKNIQTSESEAKNTKDLITLNSGNKWAQVKINDNTITLSHEIHNIDRTAVTSDVNENGDTIQVQDTEFDNAGHAIANHVHTITLPYGFKHIVGANSAEVVTDAISDVTTTQSADNTQDTLTIKGSNKWIKVDTATEDTVNIGHEVHAIDKTVASASDINGNGDTITIQDIDQDEAGHIKANKPHTYTLPFGYKVISDGINKSIAANTQDTFVINGDSWIDTTVEQGKLTVSHKVANTTGTVAYRTDDTPALGGTFKVPTYSFDANGHIFENSTYAITLPSLELLAPLTSTGKANVVTGLIYTKNGTKVQYAQQALTSLLLTGYESTATTPIVLATQTLGTGLQTLEKQIETNANTEQAHYEELTGKINTNAETENTHYEALSNIITTNANTETTHYNELTKSDSDLSKQITDNKTLEGNHYDELTGTINTVKATAEGNACSVKFNYDTETGELKVDVYKADGNLLTSTDNTINLKEIVTNIIDNRG